MNWLIENYTTILSIAGTIVLSSRAIAYALAKFAKLTSTTADDKIVARVIEVLEALALVVPSPEKK